jgi:hypothetical protein
MYCICRVERKPGEQESQFEHQSYTVCKISCEYHDKPWSFSRGLCSIVLNVVVAQYQFLLFLLKRQVVGCHTAPDDQSPFPR